MNVIPHDATNEQILVIVRHWMDVLAREAYEEIFNALGYGMLYQYDKTSGPQVIRNAIERYRSPELFPNVANFVVTDWRTAKEGNPKPIQDVVWYRPGQGLRGAISIDLPLNGKWSDLQADFVWFENADSNCGYALCLEEIGSISQTHREIDNAPSPAS